MTENSTARNYWIQRCRTQASVPAYVVINYQLNDLFEFAPDPDKRNGDFLSPIRGKPNGPTQTTP